MVSLLLGMFSTSWIFLSNGLVKIGAINIGKVQKWVIISLEKLYKNFLERKGFLISWTYPIQSLVMIVAKLVHQGGNESRPFKTAIKNILVCKMLLRPKNQTIRNFWWSFLLITLSRLVPGMTLYVCTTLKRTKFIQHNNKIATTVWKMIEFSVCLNCIAI